MDIDSMEAGPEMDRLVAEKVMGWLEDTDRSGMHGRYFREDPVRGKYWLITSGDDDYRWEPSRNIDHAMEAAERLMHDGFTMSLWFDERAIWWCCCFDSPAVAGQMMTGETMAQSVTRAVLALAMGKA